MADAGAGLDAWHGGILHAGTDEPCPPRGMSRSTKLGLHDLRGALVAGILDDVDDVRIAAHGRDALLERGHDGLGRVESLLPLRSMQTLPLLMASAAASDVTFGRLS